MSKTIKYLILANVLIFCFNVSAVIYRKHHQPEVVRVPPAPIEGLFSALPKEPERQPIKYTISQPRPSYMNYQQTVARLKEWNKEAPEITEVGAYGKSSKGQDLYYFRIKKEDGKPKVLITACIHGNEPLASSTVMWYIGALLEKYPTDEKIRDILDSRDLYFVPVVSPDSYPNSRHVDGVDPNRNFPGLNNSRQSVAPVAAIQDLFNKIKPSAVISAHTWGRVFLVPYGDKMANSENHEDYKRIIGKMAEMSGYRWIRACDMYGPGGSLNNPPIRTDMCSCMVRHMGEGKYSTPIYGTEVDWYYRNGAFSIVMELGTHQRIPSDNDTRTEFDKTYQAVLHFIKESPNVQIKR